MDKQITSKEQVILVKGKEIKIRTNIEHLRTYNEKILKENIFLETDKNVPIDFYIRTSNGNNLAFVSIDEDGPERYEIKQGQYLGTLKIK